MNRRTLHMGRVRTNIEIDGDLMRGAMRTTGATDAAAAQVLRRLRLRVRGRAVRKTIACLIAAEAEW